MKDTLPLSDARACIGCAAHGSNERALPGRREFLTTSAASLALLALAACGLSDATAPTTVSATAFKLSDYPQLANVGGVAMVSIGGSPVAIVRESATTFSAFSRICPHQGQTVQQVS